MFGRSFFAIFILAAAAAIFAGCGAGSSAPAGWLEIPSKVRSQAYGAWAEVRCKDDTSKKSKQTFRGELLAIEEDNIFILADTGLISILVANVEWAKLTSYDPKLGSLRLWVVGGSLATASHGLAAIFSLPTWLLVGNIATISQSNTPNKSFPGKSWTELRMYARFPQGLPPGFDRRALKPKPLSEKK